MPTHEERLALARLSLDGLSIGDAFGDRFFIHADMAQTLIRSRAFPKEPWAFTDDTNMALSIYENLHLHQDIEQDSLSKSFAEHYAADRGYGPAMHRLLSRIGEGESWRDVAPNLFDGQGSYGNGGAMRVAPVGAYFFDNLETVVEQARKSAEITHAHEEGIAGAIAVAVAAAVVLDLRHNEGDTTTFFDRVLAHVPESEVKSRIKRARDIRSKVVDHVIGMIGNGYKITAQDTVPYALWCVAQHMDNFDDALWLTASGLGDVDTNCAIVGGIVSLYVGEAGIAHYWHEKRESLPEWAFTS